MNDKIGPQMQEAIRSAYAQLVATAGGRKRPGQMRMIGAIARAVAHAKLPGQEPEEASGERAACLDAPTGCGKTYAYGLGAIPLARSMGLKVVISTGTVSLQEQLVGRDLVALGQVIPDLKTVLVKGRGRYACPVRMQTVANEAPTREAAELARRLMTRLEDGSWGGDRDDLQTQPPQEAWALLTNDRNGCSGRRCSSYSVCPFYRAREAMQKADVYVVNHSLLLADALQGGGLLPKLEECVLVVDEAHNMPEVAVDTLAGRHALDEAQQWVGRSQQVLGQIRKSAGDSTVGKHARIALDAVMVMSGVLHGAKSRVARYVASVPRRKDCNDPVRFEGGQLPQWLMSIAEDCHSAAATARDELAGVLGALTGEDGSCFSDPVRDKLAADLGAVLARIERIVVLWKLMRTREIEGAPVAKWIETSEGSTDLQLCASPIAVGEFLYDVLWQRVAATVHVSATLVSTDGFATYLRESGLQRIAGVQTLRVDSPFNYADQATLIVPKGAPNPKNAQSHTEWVIDALPKALALLEPGQGALVIFPSWRQMKAVADAMPEWVQAIMLRQDMLTKREALARHDSAVKQGKRSVVMGSAGLCEGVDMRGDLCKLVFLSKLPFHVPTDPIGATLKEHLEAQGRDHFDEIVVPSAYRRLAQAVGRLVRTETDTGNVIVADSRLTGTKYGRRMLAALPPFRIGQALSDAQT